MEYCSDERLRTVHTFNSFKNQIHRLLLMKYLLTQSILLVVRHNRRPQFRHHQPRYVRMQRLKNT